MRPYKIKVSAKVIDKEIKRGWFFGDSYYIVFKILAEGVSARTSVRKYPVGISQYYDMQIGGTYAVTLYRHDDGMYYAHAE